MELLREIGSRFSHRLSLGQIDAIRKLLLAILLLNIVLLMMQILTVPSNAASLGVKLSATMLFLIVGWRWTRWMRGGHRSYLELLPESLVIVLASVAVGDSMPTLGIVYTAFYFRPLVGSLRFALTGAALSIGAFFAGSYFSPHEHHFVLSGEVLGQLPMLGLTAGLACLLSYTFHRQEDLTNKLSDAERQYRSLVEQLPEVVFTTSPHAKVTYASPQVQDIIGLPAEELIGMSIADVDRMIHPRDRDEFMEAAGTALAQHKPFSIESRLLKGMTDEYRWVQIHARPITGPDGALTHWLGTIGDIHERKMLEDRVAYQAFHDDLTGLPNRLLLRDRIEHAIARGIRGDSTLAILFLDLDNFKIVNDSLGHQAGDELIQAIAERVESVVRGADTVARIGGDEFIVLLEDLEDEGAAIYIAERVLAALMAELTLKGQVLNVTGSIGIVFSAAADADPDDLIRHADLAMYAAKQRGRCCYALYTPEMGVEAVERLEIETGLRRALDQNQLVVHFQPVVDLRCGKMSEVEGLVRWNHPERGLLPPGAFLDVAEETGLIRAIDLWVLRETCRQVRAWQLAWTHHEDLIASVNLSPSQLREKALSEQVAAILQETGLQPRHLKLEITEHAMVADIKQAKQALIRLAALGVKLAIDDFGTGNSALNYLREFPIDTLKIDRSFVTGLRQGAGDVEMVQAMITLAQSLGLNVTAEGIEGDEYHELLRFGCDHGQGYHFARPQQASVLEYLVRQPVLSLETYASLSEVAAG